LNLPAKDKMAAPGYQAILNSDIPTISLPDGAGTVRVIAGEYGGQVGPARTFSPMHVRDLRLTHGGISELSVPDGWNTALIVLRGTVLINGSAIACRAQMVCWIGLSIEANNDAVVLLLSGEPIDEPIVGHGPFVMNSQEEITQTIADFNSVRFGQ
jgi:redox-sensitive bicupin YhaK (pirin superfamily)